MLSDFDALLEEFKSNHALFEINISNQFGVITILIYNKKSSKRKLAMIDQTKEREKNVLKDLNQANLNIINSWLVVPMIKQSKYGIWKRSSA